MASGRIIKSPLKKMSAFVEYQRTQKSVIGARKKKGESAVASSDQETRGR